MSQYIQEFIDLVNFEPAYTINPDSFKLSKINTSVHTFNALTYFQTLDGHPYNVWAKGVISSPDYGIKNIVRKIIIMINGTYQELEVQDDSTIVSLDAQIFLHGNTNAVQFYWVQTSDGVDNSQNNNTTYWEYLRTDINLKNTLKLIDFNITMTDAAQVALNTSLSTHIDYMVWKLRIKIDSKNYFTAVSNSMVNWTPISTSFADDNYTNLLPSLKEKSPYVGFVELVNNIFALN